MEFKTAKDAVRRILEQYAGQEIIEAAIVAIAALNELSAERGVVFRAESRTATFHGADEQNN
jgi:hypothetical protein